MCGKMGTRTGWRMGIMRLPGWSFYFPAGNQCWYIGIGRHEQAYLVDPAFCCGRLPGPWSCGWIIKTPRRVRTSSAVADWAELAGLAGLAGWPGLTGLDHLAHVAGLAGLEIDHISRWVDGYQKGCRTPLRMGLQGLPG